MKILFFTYDIPWPLDAGGKIRAYHLLKQLSVSHNMTLFSFYRSEDQLKDAAHLKDICYRSVFVKRKHKLAPHNLYFLPFLPYPAALYYTPYTTQLLLRELNERSYDIVHFESFYTSPYISYISDIPTVLGTENVEWRIYDDYARARKQPILRSLLSFEVSRIRKFEERIWKSADLCLAVSEENAREIHTQTNTTVPVIRNGVDLDQFAFNPKKTSGNTMLFVGNFAYIQNTESAQWIVSDILPQIQAVCTFKIVGRNAPPSLTVLDGTTHGNVRIAVDGSVDRIEDAYGASDILLAPIRAGSGTQFKILEAMASGTAVVTNRLGAEGILSKKGSEASVGEDGVELASLVDALFSNREKRASQAIAARTRIEKYFSWDAIGASLEREYSALLRRYRSL